MCIIFVTNTHKLDSTLSARIRSMHTYVADDIKMHVIKLLLVPENGLWKGKNKQTAEQISIFIVSKPKQVRDLIRRMQKAAA